MQPVSPYVKRMRSEQNSACSTLYQLNHPMWVLLPNAVLPVVFSSDGNPEGPVREHLLKYRSAMQPPGRSAVCVCSTSISIPKLSRYPTLCIKTCITRLRTGYKKGKKISTLFRWMYSQESCIRWHILKNLNRTTIKKINFSWGFFNAEN